MTVFKTDLDTFVEDQRLVERLREIPAVGCNNYRRAGKPQLPDASLQAFFPFVARIELTGEDEIVDLRPKEESSELIHWAARRIPPEALTDTLVPGDRRLVLACASGLRAWRAAETLQHIWPGEIVLVAACAS